MSPLIRNPIHRITLPLLLATQLLAQMVWPATSVSAQTPPPNARQGEPSADPAYIEAIQRAAAMTNDPQAQNLAAAHDLNIVNVMWEDTGRYQNSSVGPNISDVTIQVMHRDPQTGQYLLDLMPVIRYPNFTDKTADISADQFYLLVGNEHGQELHTVSLREYLANIRQYLHDPDSWAGRRGSLLAERDSHVLVSAQAAFLPVPQDGKAQFNPVIFNYQSYQGDPAVLVIVATREGASATVIDNVRDAIPSGFSWGQRLFFNQDGERASFTGERLSEFANREGAASGESPEAAGEAGLNMVLVIQVPLKQKLPMIRSTLTLDEGVQFAAPEAAAKSDVEAAVIGHGEVEGPFTEIDHLAIERDERFPIRVTVQFYKATSNGVVSPEDMQAIADQIDRVYSQANYVGSLVVDGDTGRPTEYDGPKEEPPGWWEAFWERYEKNTDMNRQQAYDLWQRLKLFAGRWFDF